MFQFINKTGIGVGRKHRRIRGCMIRQEHTYREQYKRGQEHAEPDWHRTVFRNLLPDNGDGEIEREKHHCDHQGNADAAFADDGS